MEVLKIAKTSISNMLNKKGDFRVMLDSKVKYKLIGKLCSENVVTLKYIAWKLIDRKGSRATTRMEKNNRVK
jgi:hypothetical protein